MGAGAYFLTPWWVSVSWCPCLPSQWALALVVALNRVAAVRARSSKRFIGYWVLAGRLGMVAIRCLSLLAFDGTSQFWDLFLGG